MARRLGVPKSNAFDLASSLAQIHLLERTAANRYRLGWRWLTTSRNHLDSGALLRAAVPLMRELATAVGEQVVLAVWDGRRAICVATVAGHHGPALPALQPGSRMDATTTAVGQVLLAHHAPDPPDGAPAEAAQQDAIRTVGLAQLAEPAPSDVLGIACAVRDGSTQVVAALAVVAPSSRGESRASVYRRAIERFFEVWDMQFRVVEDRRIAGADAQVCLWDADIRRIDAGSNGKLLTVSGMDIIHVVDGRLSRDHAFMDTSLFPTLGDAA